MPSAFADIPVLEQTDSDPVADTFFSENIYSCTTIPPTCERNGEKMEGMLINRGRQSRGDVNE
jgi:hypothetical protein